MAPFYIAAYGITAVCRWRSSKEDGATKRLALSFVAVVAVSLLGSWMVWALYAYLQGWLGLNGFSWLCSGEFFHSFLAFIRSALSQLFAAPSWNWLGALQTLTAPALLLCCLVPLLHGAIRLRDSRCLMLCAMLPCALCALLLGGQCAVAPLALLALGWIYTTLVRRQEGLWMGLHAALTLFYCTIEIIL